MGWTTKKQWINVASLLLIPLYHAQGKEESTAVI
jgi:hypothetical protein